MFNISKAFIDGTFDPDYFRWCFDRAAQSQAKQAANTAGNVAGSEESAAQAESAQLLPFYKSWMNAQHGYNPEQTNELLDYAGAGTAGSGATTAGQAASEAARTRNTSGFSSALDQAARDRAKQMGTIGAQIGAEDVAGAKQLNQEGAAGMAGLYGTNTEAMLKAMGIQTGDINAETDAGKSGWFQNMLGALNGVGSLARGLKAGSNG